jgi:hypothetical protein
MPISPQRRAQINRQNAQKSTGPRTPQGKAASRGNALRHGLTATTLDPTAETEPGDAYQQLLARWVDDLQPRNVLEHAMVERACRATWKLRRCARYEQAAEACRAARLREADADGPVDPVYRARQLGVLLLLTLDGYERSPSPPPPPPPGV